MTTPPRHQPPYGPPRQPSYGQQYGHPQRPQYGPPTQPYLPYDQTSAGPIATPPKRRRRWPWIVAGVVALLVVIGLVSRPSGPTVQDAATSAAPTSAAAAAPAAAAPVAPAPAPARAAAEPAAAEPAASDDTITYEVTGVTKANNITYIKDANFGQQQANNEPLPWSTTVEIESNGLGRITSLVAQSGSGGSGSITCRILDSAGNEITSSTSSGPYAVVTCSGSS